MGDFMDYCEMVISSVQDERKSWDKMLQLRKEVFPEAGSSSGVEQLFGEVRANNSEEALQRVAETIHATLDKYSLLLGEAGRGYDKMSPGHSLGHLTRDYVHALALVDNLDADPRHLFVGGVAGVLHDAGNAIVERFAEEKRAVRHAEAGALFFDFVANEYKEIGLNSAERALISYAIAAHTHYLRPSEVKCADGETRKIEPYIDTDAAGKPLLGFWLARWVDRLDCNGPCFPARHYLTLGEEHKDFDGEKHFQVDLAPHLEPRLLPEAERRAMAPVPNQTMLEHMKMFADSQNNQSPYGKHDFGMMVEIRDVYKGMLLDIVRAVDTSAKHCVFFNSEEEGIILGAWKPYLSTNIEPTLLGKETAEKLDTMFSQLPEKTRHAWEDGFLQAMVSYAVGWSEPRLEQLEQLSKKYGSQILTLPGIIEDVREVINPNPEWVKPADYMFRSQVRNGSSIRK